ncbi:hypothetical protein F5Y11DRAFT_348324 [Daldinia sp. FL1419]|nr:hypothetical protein F5Y11DRAFT_348324 [Daldinia sp. FL1419]
MINSLNYEALHGGRHESEISGTPHSHHRAAWPSAVPTTGNPFLHSTHPTDGCIANIPEPVASNISGRSDDTDLIDGLHDRENSSCSDEWEPLKSINLDEDMNSLFPEVYADFSNDINIFDGLENDEGETYDSNDRPRFNSSNAELPGMDWSMTDSLDTPFNDTHEAQQYEAQGPVSINPEYILPHPFSFTNLNPAPTIQPPHNLSHSYGPLDLTIAKFQNTTHQLPSMESYSDHKKEFVQPRKTPHSSDDEFQQDTPEAGPSRKSSALRACESCLPTGLTDKGRPVACLFYKRDPVRYYSCIEKRFSNVSSLRQHLNKKHKLGKYHCTNCWVTFVDKKSLDGHVTRCEPTHGKAVEQLGSITKQRMALNVKWYVVWDDLFGTWVDKPTCPYIHPTRDMADHLFSQLVQYLRAQGRSLNVSELKDAISGWLSSYEEPLIYHPAKNAPESSKANQRSKA